ncbi:MAG: PIG-L deacetylase family protein [Verrucomicrobiia bacterium]
MPALIANQPMNAATAETFEPQARPGRTLGREPTFEQWLRDGATLPFPGKVGLVVAHPDDEVIGAGAHLSRFPQLQILHVTDGAPRDLVDANREGFESRKAYALARVQELSRALSMAGQPPAVALSFGVVDQEASLNMVGIARRLASWLANGDFDVILTHPYEGGHPDHDATAFAVHASFELLRGRRLPQPELMEMTFYHNRFGSMATGRFLAAQGVEAITFALPPEAQEVKRRMFNAFATQRQTLQWFQTETESFRPAPRYDFSAPPHSGTLYYELFNWGMTGERWRELAREALDALELGWERRGRKQGCAPGGERRFSDRMAIPPALNRDITGF